MLRHGLNAFIPWESYGISQILKAESVWETQEKYYAQEPDILILDIGISGDMTQSLLEDMRHSERCCALILMGEHMEFNLSWADYGVVDFLRKPVEPDMMQLAIARSIAMLENHERIQNQLKSASTKLENAKSLLIQNLALEITRGVFESHKGLLDRRFAELGIHFSFRQYLCFVAAICIPKSSNVQKNVCFKAIRNSIFERFPIKTDVTVADSLTINDDNHISIIIGYDNTDDLKEIEQFVVSAFENINSIFGLPYVLVISEVTFSITDIRKIYRRAMNLCSYLLFTTQYGTHHSLDYEKQNPIRFFTNLDHRTAITKHLIKNDTTALKRDVADYRQRVLSIPIKDTFYVFLGMQEIMGAGIAYLNNQNMQIDNVYSSDVFTREFFDDFETIDALSAWLEQFLLTLCTLNNKNEDKINKSAIAEIMVKYVKAHYSEQLSLQSVSKIMHYNPNYLGRVFYQEERIKFSDYLRDVRLSEAKRLLSTTQTPIHEISSMIGYQDSSYFFKVFKKEIGITPSDYRAMEQRNLTDEIQ